MTQSEQTSGECIVPQGQLLKDIKRKTRKQYSAEDYIRIVLDGLRGEESIAELCRRGHRTRLVLTRSLPLGYK